jgi:hypothetical protein
MRRRPPGAEDGEVVVNPMGRGERADDTALEQAS